MDESLLIVDDDESIISILKVILESEGFIVDYAYDGRTAVAKSERGVFDVALLDYVLPDIRGDEVAEKIRKRTPTTGIVLITGYPSAVDDSKRRLFDAFLVKPTQPEQLIEIIHGLIARGSRLEPAPGVQGKR